MARRTALNCPGCKSNAPCIYIPPRELCESGFNVRIFTGWRSWLQMTALDFVSVCAFCYEELTRGP